MGTSAPTTPTGRPEPRRSTAEKENRVRRTRFFSVCSIKKNHARLSVVLFYGAGDEARTRYLHLGKVALYQMSYTCSDENYYNLISRRCQPFF